MPACYTCFQERFRKESMLNLIYPRRCPICDGVLPFSTTYAPHPYCMQTLLPVESPFCLQCGKPLDSSLDEYCYDCGKSSHLFKQGRALFQYRGSIKFSMYQFKYGNRREYAQFYASYAAAQLSDWLLQIHADVLIPIPLHPHRLRERGYNQASLFAKELSRLTGIPYRDDLLLRTSNTAPMKLLSDKERRNNVKKAFHVVPNVIHYRYIVLVDDIYTTGSTIDAAASALLSTNVNTIFSLCICIGRGI